MLDRRHFLLSGTATLMAAPAIAQSERRPDPLYNRAEVEVRPNFRPGTVHIDLGWKLLYFITGESTAIR
jgi:lipoprotein-anchoring transpeptidase ErfK/SrfK